MIDLLADLKVLGEDQVESPALLWECAERLDNNRLAILKSNNTFNSRAYNIKVYNCKVPRESAA